MIIGFLLALSVTMALIPPLIGVAGRWKFLDQPSERKVHSTPVPRIGGVAMAAGTLLAVVVAGNFAAPIPALIVALGVLLAFGVWDDRQNLPPSLKLVGQIIAALIVMWWGGVTVDTVTLAGRHAIEPWLSYPLTLFFLLGATNAINLTDGLDGLAGGTTLLSLAAIALLALTIHNTPVAVVAIVLAGAILGFLRFNTHPARIFMGDGGSQMLGFAAGTLSIILTQEPNAPLSAALPLLLLGVPIIDTFLVMVQRILEGRSPFTADRNHIHHRLLKFGFEHHEAVVIIYLAQALWFVAAWFLRYESDVCILSIFAFSSALIVGSLVVGARSGWRVRAGNSTQGSRMTRFVLWLRDERHAPRWADWWLFAGIACYGALVAANAPAIASDTSGMMLALAVFLCAAFAWRGSRTGANWVTKGALYITAVVAVYLDARQHITAHLLEEGRWVLFGSLAIAIALRFRLSRDRQLTITPLDVLIVCATLIIPNLPGSFAKDLELGESAAKLVILFYGLEILLAEAKGHWRKLSLGGIGFLLAAAAHGFL